MIPYYLKKHLIDVKEKKDKMTGILVSSTGNTDLEIYYYGELMEDLGPIPYICDGDFPCLIVARDPLTHEEFVIFDGLKHGYNAMFCDEYEKNIVRDLKLYDFQKGKISVTFGYAIDYEEEKDIYVFNENNEVELIDGSYLDFEKVKSIGYDWLSIKFVKKNREFVDLELA